MEKKNKQVHEDRRDGTPTWVVCMSYAPIWLVYRVHWRYEYYRAKRALKTWCFTFFWWDINIQRFKILCECHSLLWPNINNTFKALSAFSYNDLRSCTFDLSFHGNWVIGSVAVSVSPRVIYWFIKSESLWKH